MFSHGDAKMKGNPALPPPVYRGRLRMWKLSALLAYEAELAGEPPPPPLPPEQERWLTAAQVRERLSVSDMWIWRRLQEAEAAL